MLKLNDLIADLSRCYLFTCLFHIFFNRHLFLPLAWICGSLFLKMCFKLHIKFRRREKNINVVKNLLHYSYMSRNMNSKYSMLNKSPKIQQHHCRNMTLMHVFWFLHNILWMNFFYYSNYFGISWFSVSVCRFFSCYCFSLFSSLLFSFHFFPIRWDDKILFHHMSVWNLIYLHSGINVYASNPMSLSALWYVFDYMKTFKILNIFLFIY